MMRIKTELDLDAPAPLAWCAWGILRGDGNLSDAVRSSPTGNLPEGWEYVRVEIRVLPPKRKGSKGVKHG
jgi:hypothetical protein